MRKNTRKEMKCKENEEQARRNLLLSSSSLRHLSSNCFLTGQSMISKSNDNLTVPMVAVPMPKSPSSGVTLGHKKKEVAPLPPISPASSVEQLPSEQPMHDYELKGTCPFQSEHNDSYKEMINVMIDMSPQDVYSLLFENSEVILDAYRKINYTNISITPWKKHSDTQENTRTLTCTAQLPSKVLGPSHCQVKEIFTSYEHNKVNELYVVHSTISNSGLPYADNFRIYTHCCLKAEYDENEELDKLKVDSEESSSTSESSVEAKRRSTDFDLSKTRLSFYCQVKFLKSTFFLVKGIIEKGAYDGIHNFLSILVDNLAMESSKQRPNGLKRLQFITESNNDQSKPKTSSNVNDRTGSSLPLSQMLLFAFALSLLFAVAAMNLYVAYHLKNIDAITPAMSKLAALDENQLNSLMSTFHQARVVKTEEVKKLKEIDEMMTSYFNKLKLQINSILHNFKKATKELEQMRSLLSEYELELLKKLRNYDNLPID